MTQSAPSPSRFTPRRLLSDVLELLGSMRFAVSLLMFICMASVIGTVLAQNRSSQAYIDQFGPFWFELFDKFSIWHVYNSWWFLLIMAFLVASTSLCLIRNAPKMIQDARSFREYVRESSLHAFTHRVETLMPAPAGVAAERVQQWLRRNGYAVRTRDESGAVMLSAKRGSANRLGYIFAHAAIVIICVGGLLDSELLVRLQVWFGDKHPIVQNMLINEVPPSGRLSVGNPSFRANVLIPEGSKSNSAVVMVGDGALVQPLPFSITLKKFIIDYYSTGMPSRFASQVQVEDPQSGERFETTIEVNEPLRYKGVAVYQSSFDDGGSTVSLTGYPLNGPGNQPFEVDGTVGRTADVKLDEPGAPASLQVEITGLRPINVEDLSGGNPQPRAFGEHVAAVTGSAAGKKNEHLRNVGPSVEYRLIDASGQARQYHNYMLPAQLDGASVFLAGVRDSEAQGYRYLRIPADEASSMREFMAVRAALDDPALRQQAAQRFAARNRGQGGADAQALQSSAERALATFATGGLQAVARFLEGNVPPAELPRAAEIVVRLIGSSVSELRGLARERAGLPALDTADAQAVERNDAWNRLAVAALSDLSLYPAPVLLTLNDFKHVQASVFQVSRTPGKMTVYIGCLMLVLGVFSMFYIRDRRIWVWVRPAADGAGSHVMAAMTSQRRTLDFNREFGRFRQALLQLGAGTNPADAPDQDQSRQDGRQP